MFAISTPILKSRQGFFSFAVANEHHFLNKTIGTSLKSYDQYACKVTERVLELSDEAILSADVVTSVRLKFLVGAEWLQSIIVFEFIPDVESYENLENAGLRISLDRKGEKQKDVVTSNTTVRLVEK